MTNSSSLICLPAFSLLKREIVRFARQRSRVVTALLSPLLMWLVIGAGIGRLFVSPLAPAGGGYLEYFFPGTVLMVLLFTAIFSTITLIEDRREGFLQSVLVAPVSPVSIVLGRVGGATVLAVAQAVLLLAIAPFLGIPINPGSFFLVLGALAYVAAGLGTLGFLIAWRLDSIQGFHGIMNLLLIPMWFLSGALFPSQRGGTWISWMMAANPLTYGLALIRRALYLGSPYPLPELPNVYLSCIVWGLFMAGLFVVSLRWMKRTRIVPA